MAVLYSMGDIKMAEAAYIQLEPRKKQRIIWGNNLMFLSTVMFSFALPVAIPTFMEFYGIVKYQALILGIGGIVGSICILHPACKARCFIIQEKTAIPYSRFASGICTSGN